MATDENFSNVVQSGTEISESIKPVMKMEIGLNNDFPYLLPLQWNVD